MLLYKIDSLSKNQKVSSIISYNSRSILVEAGPCVTDLVVVGDADVAVGVALFDRVAAGLLG